MSEKAECSHLVLVRSVEEDKSGRRTVFFDSQIWVVGAEHDCVCKSVPNFEVWTPPTEFLQN